MGIELVLREDGIMMVEPFEKEREVLGEIGLDYLDDVDELDLLLCYDYFWHIEYNILRKWIDGLMTINSF